MPSLPEGLPPRLVRPPGPAPGPGRRDCRRGRRRRPYPAEAADGTRAAVASVRRTRSTCKSLCARSKDRPAPVIPHHALSGSRPRPAGGPSGPPAGSRWCLENERRVGSDDRAGWPCRIQGWPRRRGARGAARSRNSQAARGLGILGSAQIPKRFLPFPRLPSVPFLRPERAPLRPRPAAESRDHPPTAWRRLRGSAARQVGGASPRRPRMGRQGRHGATRAKVGRSL